MSIVRLLREDRRRWVTASTLPMEDETWSYGAIGLWIYLLSKPDDWSISPKHLAEAHGTSQYAVRKLLNELRLHGFADLKQLRNEDGTVAGSEWVIYESPRSRKPESQAPSEPRCRKSSPRSTEIASHRNSVITELGVFETIPITGYRNYLEKDERYTHDCEEGAGTPKKVAISFDSFWDAFDKKRGRKKCEALWEKFDDDVKAKIMEHVSRYVAETPDKRFRKDPLTYLTGACWNDEIIPASDFDAVADDPFEWFKETEKYSA